MKAIKTKYHGPTNFRGARISANAEGVKGISISYPHELNSDDAHRLACRTLCDKYSWKGETVMGGFKDFAVHVFTS